jgi:hypothetical protein
MLFVLSWRGLFEMCRRRRCDHGTFWELRKCLPISIPTGFHGRRCGYCIGCILETVMEWRERYHVCFSHFGVGGEQLIPSARQLQSTTAASPPLMFRRLAS